MWPRFMTPDCRRLCLQSLLELSRSQPSEGSGHSQVEVSPRRPIRPRATPRPQHPQLQSCNSLHGATHSHHQLRASGGINNWPACPIPRSASAQHAPPGPIPPPSDVALRRHPASCKRSRSDALACGLPDHCQGGAAGPPSHPPAPSPAAKQEAGPGNPMWGAVMQLLQAQLELPARQDALGAMLGLQVCAHLGRCRGACSRTEAVTHGTMLLRICPHQAQHKSTSPSWKGIKRDSSAQHTLAAVVPPAPLLHVRPQGGALHMLTVSCPLMQTGSQQETATTSLVAALQAMGKGRLAAPHQQPAATGSTDRAAASLRGRHPSSLYKLPPTMHPAVKDSTQDELRVR